MTNNKAIILLSGGLDSLVALSEAVKKYSIEYAIFFNYGQKAYKRELKASEEFAQSYGIKTINIKLDWFENLIKDSKSDWVPNRNGVFINIAAAYAEQYDIQNIIIGINREEAEDFKDNSKEFLDTINEQLKNSTQNEVKVLAPLINNTKEEIIKIGLNNSAPLEKIYSCYKDGERHCGECASCKLLKVALIKNGRKDLIDKLF